MTVLDESSFPYPGMMNVAGLHAKRLARLAPDAVPPAEPAFTPPRHPGETLAGRPVPSAGRVTNLALLTRVRDRLRKSSADLADERARYALAEIVYAAARHAEPPYGAYCPDCKAAGWCEACEQADAKSAGLYRLHDLILAADTYAAAVILVARSGQPPMTIHAEGR
jgi:hypothetical protein